MAQKVDVHSKSMKRKKGPENHTNICQDLPAAFVKRSTQPAVVVDQVMPPVLRLNLATLTCKKIQQMRIVLKSRVRPVQIPEDG